MWEKIEITKLDNIEIMTCKKLDALKVKNEKMGTRIKVLKITI